MAIYGYARCSTNEDKQDINRQIRELKDAGAEEVVFEYEHGDAKVKKELHMLLDMATAGDTIITLEVSRLSRSTQQLCEIIDVIREKKLRLVIVGSITIDCRNGQTDLYERSVLTDGGCVQSVGTGDDTRQGEVRDGERQEQGQADWQTPDHERGHPHGVLQALSGVCGGDDEPYRTGKGVRAVQTNGV